MPKCQPSKLPAQFRGLRSWIIFSLRENHANNPPRATLASGTSLWVLRASCNPAKRGPYLRLCNWKGLRIYIKKSHILCDLIKNISIFYHE
ncbi:MAG: hypothetical protein A3F47_00680 [Candidatus Staskawiczbacteria bacterium RIFCSPHIGHO2_12_FULL_38_11]|uniref:Uncharacterized protein n=1 Tax=Candidatus Staskawiczbacteria bacterium RIFCSPHIGHO2_12_FULL_38_11 TaxID=1802209 RepID=A0A1G2I6K2_9BACT|nr:MAG: hypothetical protein A3F47_00680 [Candidatus Staskawiczbacteria bacterium RIFCSPHIGHO2_12_FULL_38_11]